MSCNLQPPNMHLLSDSVIGSVVCRSNSHQPESSSALGKRDFVDDMLKTLTTAPLTGHKRLQSPTNKPRKRMKAIDLATPKIRRERCRANQERYREKQRKYTETLDETVKQLREDVKILENCKLNVASTTPTNESIWYIAAEYFRLFRSGYMVSLTSEETSNEVLTEPLAQLEFLRSNMVPDVTDGLLCGAEAILDNWRLLSLYFNNVGVQLKRLEKAPGNSLVATSVIRFTIGENTLKRVFPHLMIGKKDKGALAAKLLDRRFVLRGSVRFDWDGRTRRVVRIESKADLLRPMLRIFGNLKDVETVFADACVSLWFTITARYD